MDCHVNVSLVLIFYFILLQMEMLCVVYGLFRMMETGINSVSVSITQHGLLMLYQRSYDAGVVWWTSPNNRWKAWLKATEARMLWKCVVVMNFYCQRIQLVNIGYVSNLCMVIYHIVITKSFVNLLLKWKFT